MWLSTHVIVPSGPVVIVATTVVTLPTSSIIVCLARHTTRMLRSFYRLSDILASRTPRYLTFVSTRVFDTIGYIKIKRNVYYGTTISGCNDLT